MDMFMESVRCFRCRAREISVFGDINAIILDSDQHAIDQISQGIYVFICQGAWIWPQDIGNKISLLKIETNMNMESFDQEPFLFCSGNWSKYLVRLVDGKVWEARDGKAFFPYSLHIDLQLGQKVVAITAGGEHCLLLTSTGLVYSCGSNRFGELGYETRMNYTEMEKIEVRRFSHVVNLRRKMIAIAAGVHHSCALEDNGRVWTWGRNSSGQLGRSTNYRNSRNSYTNQSIVPELVTSNEAQYENERDLSYKKFRQTHSRKAKATNDNEERFVAGNSDHDANPSIVDSLLDENVILIACGHNFCLVVSVSNTSERVWGWGDAREAQIGPYMHNRVVNVPVFIFEHDFSHPDDRISHICGGGHHSAILTQKGQMMTWGANSHGQLGRFSLIIAMNSIDPVPTCINGFTEIVTNLEDSFLYELLGKMNFLVNEATTNFPQSDLQESIFHSQTLITDNTLIQDESSIIRLIATALEATKKREMSLGTPNNSIRMISTRNSISMIDTYSLVAPHIRPQLATQSGSFSSHRDFLPPIAARLSPSDVTHEYSSNEFRALRSNMSEMKDSSQAQFPQINHFTAKQSNSTPLKSNDHSQLTESQNILEKQLRIAFDNFDSDRSGEIDVSHLTSIFSMLNKNPTSQDIREAIQIMDADNSGAISWRDFVHWGLAFISERPKSNGSLETGTVFSKMRANKQNKNNSIFAEGNLLDALVGRNKIRATNSIMSSSWERLKNSLEYSMERNERLQLRRMFSSIDRDGSGALDLMEMGHAILRLGLSKSQEHARALVLALDADGNGEVDEDEFVNFMYLLRRGEVHVELTDRDNSAQIGETRAESPKHQDGAKEVETVNQPVNNDLDEDVFSDQDQDGDNEASAKKKDGAVSRMIDRVTKITPDAVMNMIIGRLKLATQEPPVPNRAIAHFLSTLRQEEENEQNALLNIGQLPDSALETNSMRETQTQFQPITNKIFMWLQPKGWGPGEQKRRSNPLHVLLSPKRQPKLSKGIANLVNKGLSDADVRVLCRTLQKVPILKHVNLRRNYITDAGVYALLQLLYWQQQIFYVLESWALDVELKEDSSDKTYLIEQDHSLLSQNVSRMDSLVSEAKEMRDYKIPDNVVALHNIVFLPQDEIHSTPTTNSKRSTSPDILFSTRNDNFQIHQDYSPAFTSTTGYFQSFRVRDITGRRPDTLCIECGYPTAVTRAYGPDSDDDSTNQRLQPRQIDGYCFQCGVRTVRPAHFICKVDILPNDAVECVLEFARGQFSYESSEIVSCALSSKAPPTFEQIRESVEKMQSQALRSLEELLRNGVSRSYGNIDRESDSHKVNSSVSTLGPIPTFHKVTAEERYKKKNQEFGSEGVSKKAIINVAPKRVENICSTFEEYARHCASKYHSTFRRRAREAVQFEMQRLCDRIFKQSREWFYENLPFSGPGVIVNYISSRVEWMIQNKLKKVVMTWQVPDRVFKENEKKLVDYSRGVMRLFIGLNAHVSITRIALGTRHTIITTRAGTVWVCGRTPKGQTQEKWSSIPMVESILDSTCGRMGSFSTCHIE